LVTVSNTGWDFLAPQCLPIQHHQGFTELILYQLNNETRIKVPIQISSSKYQQEIIREESKYGLQKYFPGRTATSCGKPPLTWLAPARNRGNAQGLR